MLILSQQALNSWNKAFRRKDFPTATFGCLFFPDLPVMSPTDQVSWDKARGKMKPLPTIGIDLQTFFMEFYLWSFSLSTSKMIFSNQIQIYFGELQWFPKDVFLEIRRIPILLWLNLSFFVLSPAFMISNFDLNPSDNPCRKKWNIIHNDSKQCQIFLFWAQIPGFPSVFHPMSNMSNMSVTSAKSCQKIHRILG